MCHTRRGPYANALGRRACSRRSTLRLNFELRLKRSNQSKRKMSLNPVKKPWKKAAALGLYHSGFGVSSLSLEFSGPVSPPLREVLWSAPGQLLGGPCVFVWKLKRPPAQGGTQSQTQNLGFGNFIVQTPNAGAKRNQLPNKPPGSAHNKGARKVNFQKNPKP